MEEVSNYEKKYRALKKKHKALTTDKENIDQQLTLAKKRVLRLQKERSFLLDRLLQYEQVSSDSESENSSSDSEEREEVRPAKKMKRDAEPQVRVSVTNGYERGEKAERGERGDKEERGEKRERGRRAARPKVKDTSDEQVCIARGKDKPCKSKALAGFKYCWHHAPMDPATGFIFCQYRDANKRNSKNCNIPVHKDKPEPFCNYHVKRLQKQSHLLGLKSEGNGSEAAMPSPAVDQDVEPFVDDVFSDQDDGLDVSGSGEETSPPEFQGENVVIN